LSHSPASLVPACGEPTLGCLALKQVEMKGGELGEPGRDRRVHVCCNFPGRRSTMAVLDDRGLIFSQHQKLIFNHGPCPKLRRVNITDIICTARRLRRPPLPDDSSCLIFYTTRIRTRLFASRSLFLRSRSSFLSFPYLADCLLSIVTMNATLGTMFS
jgi:hypothetical protein